MVFKAGGKINALDKWSYNGTEIETINSFKYLGFVFGSSGKLKKGLENLAIQGKKGLFNMTSSIDNFAIIHPKMKASLFDSLVSSVLSYGCEIWGFSEAKKIETLHLKFLKHTLRVRKTTPNCYVYKELNVLPLQIRRIFRIVKYWLKIISLDDRNPVNSLYNAVKLNVTENK